MGTERSDFDESCTKYVHGESCPCRRKKLHRGENSCSDADASSPPNNASINASDHQHPLYSITEWITVATVVLLAVGLVLSGSLFASLGRCLAVNRSFDMLIWNVVIVNTIYALANLAASSICLSGRLFTISLGCVQTLWHHSPTTLSWYN